MPVVDGRRPVSVATREGLQTGAEQWALLNSIPRGCEPVDVRSLHIRMPAEQPTQSFMSSTTIINTLGLSAACETATALKTAAVNNASELPYPPSRDRVNRPFVSHHNDSPRLEVFLAFCFLFPGGSEATGSRPKK